MPIYEVEDPRTGAVLELEGDSPPTEQELEEIFASAMPEGSALDAVVEPVQAIGGGLASQAASGLGGLVRLATGGDSAEATQTIQDVQSALPDFQPETQAGQKSLETIGDLINAGIDVVNVPISGLAGLATFIGSGGDINTAARVTRGIQDQGLGQTLGEETFQATESPALATAAQMAPDVAGAVLGTRAAKTAGSAAKQKLGGIARQRRQKALVTPRGEPTPAFEKALQRQGVTIDAVVDDLDSLPEIADPAQAAKRLVKQKIRRGDTDGALATKKINRYGEIVDDPVGAEAIKQGFDPGDVQAIKAANPGSKKGMEEMLKIRRSIFNNTRKAVDVQPTDVIGRSAMARFDHIRKTANEARKELDQVARQNLKGKTINVEDVSNAFFRQLDDLDVKVDQTSLPPQINFTGSQISKNRAAQKVIKDTVDLLAEDETVDALRAHKLKRQLDEMIDYKKSAQGQLTPTGERVARTVRQALNDSIRAVDDDYARINDTLSESLSAINDFNDVLGPSINPFAEGAAKAVGRDLRGLLSNRKTQTKLENAVKQLDDVAKDLGGQFDDDLGDLVNFNGILQSRFGSTKRQSFAGEIGSELGRRALRGREGLREAAIDKAGEGIEKLRNINDQEAFKSVSRLLNRDQL